MLVSQYFASGISPDANTPLRFASGLLVDAVAGWATTTLLPGPAEPAVEQRPQPAVLVTPIESVGVAS